jgi:hypothetical protein
MAMRYENSKMVTVACLSGSKWGEYMPSASLIQFLDCAFVVAGTSVVNALFSLSLASSTDRMMDAQIEQTSSPNKCCFCMT